MFRFKASVKKRLQKRRLERFHQRETINDVISGRNSVENSNEIDSSDDDFQANEIEPVDKPNDLSFSSNLFNPIDYNDDDFDNAHPVENSLSNSENSPPLFTGSSMTVQGAVRRLSSFYIDFNLNKNAVIRLLRIIKELLPSPNSLPTTWKSLMKVFGYASSSRKTFLCCRCFQQCDKSANGEKKCRNPNCSLSNRMLKSTQLVELIHMDIRSQIRALLNRNYLLLNRTDLYPKTDICFADHYRHLPGESINCITLIVHTDGAPLIKLSKQSLWPCFASIVELPPPVRDYQNNIIVLSLWSSKTKPDPNIFLHETIQELKYLIENGTSIFINDQEFRIILRTQCFISDLPAKSLFCRTINFNGYSACTECCSTGMFFILKS
jgi:hypothetical protein